MPEHTHSDAPIVNADTRHETSDVNVKGLLMAIVIFIAFGVVTHIVLYLLFHYYQQIFRGDTSEPLTQMARPVDANVPPEPRLQPFPAKDSKRADLSPTAATPVADLAQMRRAEEQAQTTFGWVDKQSGRVRIPIDLAKQLVLQKGLPVNPAAATPGAAAPPAASSSAADVAPPTTAASPPASAPATNAAGVGGATSTAHTTTTSTISNTGGAHQ